MTRRTLISVAGTAAFSQAQTKAVDNPWTVTPDRIQKYDEGVDRLMAGQTTDRKSRWFGGYPDAHGLHNGGTATGLVNAFVNVYLLEGSRHKGSAKVREHLDMALAFLAKHTSADGNLNLLTTNFNSPPDTAFAMQSMAGALKIARRHSNRDIENALMPHVLKMGDGLVKGGMHTPNHRWVASAGLARLYKLFGDEKYKRRMDQWLAEGIDIDADGQYTERSSAGYNGIVNSHLVTIALEMGREDLLDPVRRNLDAMLYLLHPGDEIVTEISRRQDLNTRGNVSGSWKAWRYLAVKDSNPVYEGIARRYDPGAQPLIEYPELTRPGPDPKPEPLDYEKQFPLLGISRVRRGATSATVLQNGNTRLFTLRRGAAVINAVRAAAAFFGKAQFAPEDAKKEGNSFVWRQKLSAPYWQPLDPPQKVTPETWFDLRKQRKQTEIANFEFVGTLTEHDHGFRFRLQAHGTGEVPVAIEVNLRDGGLIEGVEIAPGVKDGYILAGDQATLTMGGDKLRFGPGLKQHTYTEVRGAEPKLDGPSVFLTGYTPFDHTIDFTW